MTAFNVMFTSVGRRVSLVKYFKSALTELSLAGKIMTADRKTTAPAAWVGDAHELLPQVTDASYIPRLLEICLKHDIKLLIPLIDTELHILADHRQAFEAIGVCALVSSPAAARICFNKRHTAAFFESINVHTPAILDAEQLLTDPNSRYPVMLKPAQGSGSAGVTKINNADELRFFLKYIPDPLVQQYINGLEYTVDVLMDFEGRACAAVPRLRMEVRAGEVSKGITVKNKEIMHAAKKVAEALPGARGCITLQCFVTPAGEIVFIEINPRFGGGVPLSLAAGAQFPKTIIQWVLKQPPDWTDMDDWQDGLVMLRYDDAFFVHQSENISRDWMQNN